MSLLNRYKGINDGLIHTICDLFALGDIEGLDAMGVPYKTAEQIASQNYQVLARLANSKKPLLNLKVDVKAMENLLNYINKETEQDRLINGLIIHGAPLEMIEANWPIARDVYYRRKKSLDLVHNTGRGRLPKRLKKKEKRKLKTYMDAFRARPRDEDGAWKLLHASMETNISVTIPWIHMKEFGNTSIGSEEWEKIMMTAPIEL